MNNISLHHCSASLFRVPSMASLSILLLCSQAQANMIVLREGESFSSYSTLEYALMISVAVITIAIIIFAICLLWKKKPADSIVPPKRNEGQVTMPTETTGETRGTSSIGGTVGIGDDSSVLSVLPQEGPLLILAGHLNTGEAINARIYYSEIQASNKQRVYIGRDSSMWLCLKDSSVSREHAQLTVREGKFWLSDRHSANGTRVAGTALPQKRFVPLSHGDQISFGKIEMRVSLQ